MLLFAEPSLVPLDRWVFSTEGHPFSISSRCTRGLLPNCFGEEESVWRSVPSVDHVVVVMLVGVLLTKCRPKVCSCVRRYRRIRRCRLTVAVTVLTLVMLLAVVNLSRMWHAPASRD